MAEEESIQSPPDIAERIRIIAEALTDGTIIIADEEYDIPDHVLLLVKLEEEYDEGESEFELEIEVYWGIPEDFEPEYATGDEGEWTLYQEVQIMTREAAAERMRLIAANIWSEQFILGGHLVYLPPEIEFELETESEGEDSMKLEIEIGWDSWEMMPPTTIAATLTDDEEDDEDEGEEDDDENENDE